MSDGIVNLILAHVWLVGALVQPNAQYAAAMYIAAVGFLIISVWQRKS